MYLRQLFPTWDTTGRAISFLRGVLRPTDGIWVQIFEVNFFLLFFTLVNVRV